MTMDSGLAEALERVDRLCDLGFASDDPAHYATIRRELEPHRETEGVDKMMRLAEAGPTLGSKRFAYPHIQSDAKDMLDTLGAESRRAHP